MNNLIKKNKKNLILIGSYILSIVLISIFNLFFLAINATKYIIILITLSFIFIMSFKSGKKRLNKGYIAGIKTWIIFTLIIIIIDLLFIKNNCSFSRIIYYIISLLVSIFGSIIGINKKAN